MTGHRESVTAAAVDERATLIAALLRLQYLTPIQAAIVVGCSPSHIRRACADGALVAIQIGQRGWRIKPSALDGWRAASTPVPAAVPVRDQRPRRVS